jgi:hypothetical protein
MGIFDEIIKGIGSHLPGSEGEGGLMDQVLNLINCKKVDRCLQFIGIKILE